MNFEEISTSQAVLLAIAVVWDMAWKGFALWKSARNNDQLWFIFMVIINSVGILPILYLLLHRQRSSQTN